MSWVLTLKIENRYTKGAKPSSQNSLTLNLGKSTPAQFRPIVSMASIDLYINNLLHMISFEAQHTLHRDSPRRNAHCIYFRNPCTKTH